jgi:hypothetical protein
MWRIDTVTPSFRECRWSIGAKIRALGHCVFLNSKLPLLNACIETTVHPARPDTQVATCAVSMLVATLCRHVIVAVSCWRGVMS